jgi:hypothetical protein
MDAIEQALGLEMSEADFQRLADATSVSN